MKKLKVAVIGCGAIAEWAHIPAAFKIPELDLFAVVDKDLERAKTVAQRHLIPHWYNDYTDLFGTVDLAIIATANSSHSEIASELLKQGIHVLCEKPMATSVNDCENMIRAARESKAKLTVGHNLRFASNIQFAKRLMSEAFLGETISLEGSFGGPFDWPARTDFYFQKGLAGGGVLMDKGVHIIDLVLWLAESNPREVHASFESFERGVEAEAFLKLRLSSGVAASIRVSRKRHLEEVLRVKGEKGWLALDLDNFSKVELYKETAKACERGGPLTLCTKENNSYLDQLESFVQTLLNDGQVAISPEDGLRVVEVIEMSYANGMAK